MMLHLLIKNLKLDLSKLRLGLFGLAFTFLFLNGAKTDAEDLIPEQQLQAGFDLAKIKERWADLTLHQGDPFGDHMVVIASDDRGYQERTFIVTDKKHCQMTFLQKNKMLIGFMDDGIFGRLFNPPNAPLYETQNAPQWTLDQAIAKGERVLSALVDRTRFNFVHPTAKYIYNQNNGEYYVGHWEIRWQRTDSKGHLFDALQGATVEIVESKGPFNGGVNLSSKYVEQSGEPLKVADVQEKAWQAAQATPQRSTLKSFFAPGHLESKPFITELRIVTPNHLLDQTELTTHRDLNARLAWTFWYAWDIDNNPKQHQSVAVWVDAYTGEILGGDVGL